MPHGRTRAATQRGSSAIRKTGWSGEMRRSSDSSDCALTPSKNTPISAFHRFR